MNSAPQPQLLKLEEVFDETAKSGTAVQEELKPAILLRCVGGQLKPYLNLTIGDNVQHSTLREQVLQSAEVGYFKDPCLWTLIGFKMPKERATKARMTIKGAKARMPKVKGRKEKSNRNERKVITRAKVSAKTRKEQVWQLVGSQGIFLESVGETNFDRLQVIQPIHLQEGLQ